MSVGRDVGSVGRGRSARATCTRRDHNREQRQSPPVTSFGESPPQSHRPRSPPADVSRGSRIYFARPMPTGNCRRCRNSSRNSIRACSTATLENYLAFSPTAFRPISVPLGYRPTHVPVFTSDPFKEIPRPRDFRRYPFFFLLPRHPLLFLSLFPPYPTASIFLSILWRARYIAGRESPFLFPCLTGTPFWNTNAAEITGLYRRARRSIEPYSSAAKVRAKRKEPPGFYRPRAKANPPSSSASSQSK